MAYCEVSCFVTPFGKLQRKFGCAKVFHGSAAENNHKLFVKRMAAQTQMRLDSFASQVADNYYEYELFKLAYKYVQEHQRSKEARCRGSFTLKIKTNRNLHVQSEYKWKDEEKQKISHMHTPDPIIAKSLGRIAVIYAQKLKLSQKRTSQ